MLSYTWFGRFTWIIPVVSIVSLGLVLLRWLTRILGSTSFFSFLLINLSREFFRSGVGPYWITWFYLTCLIVCLRIGISDVEDEDEDDDRDWDDSDVDGDDNIYGPSITGEDPLETPVVTARPEPPPNREPQPPVQPSVQPPTQPRVIPEEHPSVPFFPAHHLVHRFSLCSFY